MMCNGVAYRRRRRARRYRDEIRYLTIVILLIVAMPLGGAYMLLTEKEGLQKICGMLLTVLGVVVWTGLR